ncbi:uncharacterized protein N7496_002816 [Penicillium cataractarum]|uniref:GET complex, subunit GET2 n=1 Tax=Penicillium cataractarum TaxID=2100454 RepID=A0A9W9SKT8_9EURO|nr:uncharacterized protein N7496_002816 [Penicillium cataractarum]KAJ5380388.1 hypothetical protein N7496_002816 [Penicillium cataractarum]
MSTPEESPAQRAARLRRERLREEASPSPQLAVSPSPSPVPQSRPASAPQPDMPSADSLQAQQEAFRAMLRQVAPDQGQQNDVEDPTLKLLENLLGAMPGSPNAPPPGAPGAPAAQGAPGAMPGQSAAGFSPAAIASALGVPPFLANMLGGASQPPTEQEQKTVRIWKGLHVVFALAVAIYLLFIIGASVATFGSPPPKPATAQNPFLIFVTGEMVLTGGRVLFGGKQAGLGMVVQLFRDIVRDGSLVLFALGLGAWYTREWQAVA